MIYKNAELHNVAELVPADDGVGSYFCRISNQLRLAIKKDAALAPAGAEIRFNLIGKSARIVLQRYALNGPPEVAEVWCGCFFHARPIITSAPTEIIITYPPNIDILERMTRKRSLPFDARLIRVILPYVSRPRLLALEGRIAPPRAGQTPPRRWLAYGSSITHGCTALRPSGTFAMRAAQMLGVDLVNLGFGSSGLFEPEMAQYIAVRKDWHFMTLEMANILNLEEDEFVRRVRCFIKTIASARPRRKIFCIDFVTQMPDYDEWRAVRGITQTARVPDSISHRRQLVCRIVSELKYSNLIYINGARLLRSPVGLSTDLLHPAPVGMEEIASRLTRIIIQAGSR